jgi:sporulation protein YlmC with PRC-barrel domain
MQQVISSIIGYTVRGSDGDLGEVKEFFFDDAAWRIRYMAVETGKWLSGRRTLISMSSLDKINWASHTFHVNLSREQVRNSPDTDIDKPISRKYEIALQGYYAWNGYWGGGFYVQPDPFMDILPSKEDREREEDSFCTLSKIDPNLRSTRELAGYRIHATDGDIGHVEDFIVDEDRWDIRYIVIDTRNWLPGRRVVVSPQWIKKVDWENSKVFVDISCDSVKKSPKYTPSELITLDYERKLFEHLRKPESAAWVTFKIHAPEGANVFVAGTFNKWAPSSIRLERDATGVYEATVLIPAGRIEYKFIVDGKWCNAPDCKEEVPNVFGSTNSVLFVGENPGHKGHLHTFSRFSAGRNSPLWSTPMGG